MIWALKKMCLITNNPRKIAGLKGFGIEVVRRRPLLIETNEYNERYMETKAKKLGHLLSVSSSHDGDLAILEK